MQYNYTLILLSKDSTYELKKRLLTVFLSLKNHIPKTSVQTSAGSSNPT